MLVVWTPVLRGDDRAAAVENATILEGPRTQQFYDPENAVGKWCFEHVVSKRPELSSKQIFAISGGVTWDAFFLFADAASTLDELDQLLASGATVIDDKLVLARAVEQLAGQGER